ALGPGYLSTFLSGVFCALGAFSVLRAGLAWRAGGLFGGAACAGRSLRGCCSVRAGGRSVGVFRGDGAGVGWRKLPGATCMVRTMGLAGGAERRRLFSAPASSGRPWLASSACCLAPKETGGGGGAGRACTKASRGTAVTAPRTSRFT